MTTVKTKILVGVWGVIFIVSVAYIAFSAGEARERIEWLGVGKEHDLMGGSMERMEVLLTKGDTGTVMRALSAYNLAIKGATNETDYVRAAGVLFEKTAGK